jgi:eukaryotic-like serine/threonine-protein kinase
MAIQFPPIPRRLGPYEVGGKIGGGGMASVFLGRRADGYGQEAVVALKVIRDELAADPTFIHMFLDEAKILSRLSHPNIIRTLEYGVTGDQRFIAMELLFGRSLSDVWEALASKTARIPLALGAWICARVAEGLDHAHALTDEDGQALHVIHRDVNPSNIFLTFDGRVKLIDFGLAKMKNRRAKTGEGIVKGKVPYLSPEQILQEHVDARSDLYSLGTTLWELGSGKRLFKRESDVATIDAIRKAIVPDLREIVPDYPDPLWETVRRSLAPKADDRFDRAGDMARALEEWLGEHRFDTGREELAAFLGELFAGDRERQSEWLRAAKARSSAGNDTFPPPAPVPDVSSDSGDTSAGDPAEPPPPAGADETASTETVSTKDGPAPASSEHESETSDAAVRPAKPRTERRTWTLLAIGALVLLALAAICAR